jgi:hypothetical protein
MGEPILRRPVATDVNVEGEQVDSPIVRRYRVRIRETTSRVVLPGCVVGGCSRGDIIVVVARRVSGVNGKKRRMKLRGRALELSQHPSQHQVRWQPPERRL